MVAPGASGRACVELARVNAPDVVFVDRDTPGAGGVEVIDELLALSLGIRVVMMAAAWRVEDAVAAIRAGARGCVSTHDLLAFSLRGVLRATMSGQLVCSRDLGSAVLERLVAAPVFAAGCRPVRSRLTGREREVLDPPCRGHSTTRVANALLMSVETVRAHVENAGRKLGSSSHTELIAAAARMRGGPDPGMDR